jgi:hypothetical protein
MTHNISPDNKIESDLKQQYQARISQLQDKIIQQQKEILELQRMINMLTISKEYDC